MAWHGRQVSQKEGEDDYVQDAILVLFTESHYIE